MAARSGSTSRRCTATSPSSGWAAFRSPTRSTLATGKTRGTTSTPGSGTRTAETMRRPAPDLERFGPVERAVHRATAALVGICVGTGLALYVGPLSVAIGRRALLERVHVTAGILLPVPFLVGWCSRRFRADVRRLNRFVPEDWQWLLSP